jgi:acetyl esterase/lipase
MPGGSWGTVRLAEDRSVLSRPAPPPDTTVPYGTGPDQVVDVWFAGRSGEAEARPVVALVHGGFWRPEHDRSHLGPMAAALREVGWTVAAIEYRRTPGDPDTVVGDVRRALGAVPTLVAEAIGRGRAAPTDGSTVVVGHSAGGHLALWAAAVAPAPHLRATVALAPVADLRLAHELGLDAGAVADFLGGAADDRPDLDPARLPPPATPVALVHGGDDTRVPPALSASYAARHPSTRLVPAAGAGHFAPIDPRSEAWPLVIGEVARWTGPDANRRSSW